MQLVALETVKHRLSVGVPLPFNVRQLDSTLLLARGQVVGSLDQMDALFERGMLVDLAELQTVRDRILKAPRTELPGLWNESIKTLGQTLNHLPTEGLETSLGELSQPLLALVERDPDLAVFQVLRQHGNAHAQYGVNHSIHCAIAAFLTAHRLGWDEAAVQRAFKAALTMNVAMVELQGQLATQTTPLTDEQRQAIHTHPERSAQMLMAAGITDDEWLQAVAQHHETRDGKGYPNGLNEVTPLAALLQQCDVYTAKLSPRRSRGALTADVAARKLFAANPSSTAVAALIKEFGLYPPGSFVKLASQEAGVVVKRGASANAPHVAAMTTPRGAPLSTPVQRDTSIPAHAIVAMLPADAPPVPLSPEKLLKLVCS